MKLLLFCAILIVGVSFNGLRQINTDSDCDSLCTGASILVSSWLLQKDNLDLADETSSAVEECIDCDKTNIAAHIFKLDMHSHYGNEESILQTLENIDSLLLGKNASISRDLAAQYFKMEMIDEGLAAATRSLKLADAECFEIHNTDTIILCAKVFRDLRGLNYSQTYLNTFGHLFDPELYHLWYESLEEEGEWNYYNQKYRSGR
jgi:hypothetical protein